MKESTIKDLFKKLIDAENRHDLPVVRALVYEHEKVGDAIPTRAERPGHLVLFQVPRQSQVFSSISIW